VAVGGTGTDEHAGIYRDRYLDPCPPSMQGEPRRAAAVTLPIRPEIPGDPAASLPDWAAGLGGQPVVYLSLGTVPLFNTPGKLKTLVASLAPADLDLVVTISDLYDPAELGTQPPNVHVEKWLPLAPLLPRCDVVVCHAGSGTTLAALVAGLPLVLLPQGADQYVNAAACQRAGVARVLSGDAVTSTAIEDAVLAVAQQGSPEQATARRIASEIAAMPNATDVVRQLGAIASD
jgi:MGT family glycosyltransferase